MTSSSIRVATDVGGTFTDLVAFEVDEATGRSSIRTAKSDTTPPEFERGVLAVMEKANVDAAAVDFLAHGTTVVINALTERTGAKVGLIATEGFRDTLAIARGNRPDFFNLHYRKPEPFVPRFLRRELAGRMSYRGEEMKPLDLAPLSGIVADFRAAGVETVAICFLHAYANPAHEQAALAELRRLWPEVPAVSSHQITREWREYERTSTTVLSAYVQPVAERYLERLDSGLEERGFLRKPLRHAVELRGGLRRRGRAHPDHDGGIGPRLGRVGRGRARPAHRRARRHRPRRGRNDRQVLPRRGGTGPDHDRLLDRAGPHLLRISDPRSGGRPRGDRRGRGLDRVGRRLRKASCRTALGGGRSRPRRLRAGRNRGHHHRRQPLARAHQPELVLRRGDDRGHGRGGAGDRGGSGPSSASMRRRLRAASCASPTTTW